MYTWPSKNDELFKYVPIKSLQELSENELYSGDINSTVSSLNFSPCSSNEAQLSRVHPLVEKVTHKLEKTLQSGSYLIDLNCPTAKTIHAFADLSVGKNQEVLLMLHASQNLSEESLTHLSFQIKVETGATLTVLSFIHLSQKAQATLFSNLYLEPNAQAFWHHGVLSGAFSHVSLKGYLKKKAHFATRSCLLGSKKSYHGFQPIVEHSEGSSTCDLQTRGLASDQSQLLQHGKITVPVDSGQIEAHYSSDNLSLSKTAKIFARPDLDIATDDVVCSHGVTIGSINEEHIYYLQSRHLSRPAAKMLLLRSFVMKIFDCYPPQVSLPLGSPQVIQLVEKQLEEMLET